MPEKTDWNDVIRRYSDELRRLHEKSAPQAPLPAPKSAPEPAPAPLPVPEPIPVPEAEPTPRPSPAPPFGNEAAGTAQENPGNELVAANADRQAGETDVGTLVVRLNSARGTIPIVGATVTVFRQTESGVRLYYMGETDENGESPTWTLPTLDRELSLEPGVITPYVNYAVQVNAVGFTTVLNEGVSVFGGVKTVQRVAMLPLPDETNAEEIPPLVTRPKNPENELNGGDV